MNHLVCMEVSTPKKKELVSKMNFVPLILRGIQHITHLIKLSVMEEVPTWTNHLPCIEVQAPWKRRSNPKKGCLIGSLRCTTHTSLNEVECHKRSCYMDEPSIMYESVGTSEKKTRSQKELPYWIFETYNTCLPS